MAGSDAARADLFSLLEQSIGRDTAVALMDHIPPEGWPDFATKADVDALSAATKADVAALSAATKADLVLLEERIGRRIGGLDGRIDGLEIRIEASEQRVIGVLRGELLQTVTTLNRHLIFSVLGAVVATSGAVITAGQVA